MYLINYHQKREQVVNTWNMICSTNIIQYAIAYMQHISIIQVSYVKQKNLYYAINQTCHMS